MNKQLITINYLANEMDAMRYYNNETDCPKRRAIIENKDNLYIASEKHDGCWALCAHWETGHNLIRSRSISKITGVYGDYTDKVPHIVSLMDTLPDNTVLLAELCWDEPGTNANTVGTILRCLPAKAVERQKEHKLKAICFDMLMWDGVDYCDMSYSTRVHVLCDWFQQHYNEYMHPTTFYEGFADFLSIADEIISNGGEGLVIQRKDNPYMPGTRTAWKTLKLKQSLPEMELKVVGTLNPNKKYEGDFVDNWPYWEVFSGENSTDPETGEVKAIYDLVELPSDADRKMVPGIPVTKPYFYGWKNGITVEYNNTTCDVASGLTDEDREWLATKEAAEMIANGELYAVVKAMQTNDKGRLRHPYVVRLRNDIVKD